MIYTITLNPALDRAILVERLVEDDTTRVIDEKVYAAGKGIDVSRVIRELGGQSVALGLVGGYSGYQLEGLLINAGVMTDFTRIAEETRTNILLKDQSTGVQYVIGAAGPEIAAAEIGQFYHHVLNLRAMDYLIMSGSLPRGVTPNVYGQLILAGKKNEAFVLLDTDGRALKESVEYQPTCIKPNSHELARLMGREIRSESQILEACEEIHSRGIPYVLVSRGREGLLLSAENLRIKAVSPPVEVESTVGAGDSAVAGFVLAHSRGKEPEEWVRLACAAGAATARTPGTELCHVEEVERLLDQVEVSYL